MGVVVDSDLCNSCGVCVQICPLDCLRLDEAGLPYMKYDECWFCECCEHDCPTDALTLEIPFLVR